MFVENPHRGAMDFNRNRVLCAFLVHCFLKPMRGALELVIEWHFAVFSLPLFHPFLMQRKTLHIYASCPMSAYIPGLFCNVVVPAQEHPTQHVRYSSCNAQV
jgi:hypothetical protein